MNLQLKPGLRRVWRGTGALQIGLSARRGTLLTGLTATDLPLIERLRCGVSVSTLGNRADPLGCGRGRELVQLLADAGVLEQTSAPPGRQRPAGGADRRRPGRGPARDVRDAREAREARDAQVWSVVHRDAGDGWALVSARALRRVEIRGAGRIAGALSATLSAAGVGSLIRTAGTHGSPGPKRAERLASAGEPAESDPSPGDPEIKPDLVVLIDHTAANAAGAAELLSEDVVHLSVVIREDDVVVGPLVRPGIGPCLRCLDLHRGERDPAWPSVLAQLLNPATGISQAEESASAMLAAGVAGLQVLGHLDGVSEPASAGATLEIELPDGLIARRIWPAHPACGCHWPPQERVPGRARGPGRPRGE